MVRSHKVGLGVGQKKGEPIIPKDSSISLLSLKQANTGNPSAPPQR
jgi:hypothetical protein